MSILKQKKRYTDQDVTDALIYAESKGEILCLMKQNMIK